jgi:hypothetical protein
VVPRKAFDALTATDQQPVVNPQGTVAFSVGEAMGTAVGGVVVVAVLPSVISPLDTIGAEPPLTVSSPSAVAKAPAATSVAPATSIARNFVDCCMMSLLVSVARLCTTCGYLESSPLNWTIAE